MRRSVLFAALFWLAGFPALPCRPAEAPDLQARLKARIANIQARLREGKKTEADLAPELRELDQLLAAAGKNNAEDAAQVLLVKAMLLAQVFGQDDAAAELLRQVKREYPETGPGRYSDEILADVRRQAEARKIQRNLVPGTKFPGFEVQDLENKALSLASCRGGVVVIHFWSTRYPQCVADLPTLTRLYEENHDKGLEIVGVNMDHDREQVRNFVKDRKMAWPQVFDGKGWDNELALKCGVDSLPFFFVLDRQGTILGKDLARESLAEAVAGALAGQ